MPIDAKHILILASWYPTKENPFLGNFVERHVHLLATEHKITVIHPEVSETHSEITIESRQEGEIRTIKAYVPSGNRFLNRYRKYKAFQEALKETEKVDLIIGHVLLPNGWMFAEASRKTGAPLIWVEHGSYFRQDKPRRWTRYENWILRKVSAAAVEIVAVSEILKKDLAVHQNQEISVIGNHVDETLFTFEPKKLSEKTEFLHISTLDEQTKNPEGILQACVLLKKETSDFHLTIISDEDSSKWQRFASENKLEDFITFLGPLDWADLPQYYHQADAFILFSDYESFSIVLAESLSTGTPIIATEVGIVPSLPDNVVVRVEKNNSNNLKDKMYAMIRKELKFDIDAIREEGTKFSSSEIRKHWNHLIGKHAK